ncbi:ABC transporter permease [Aminiphilus sp.]|jgi:peptide/nickel transport system permease protein|uniref:ABC transporter permease n=1 Tax=Aminiphilus sp. TaxID=1872488 RepID=UPI0026307F1E|nr:ABC transporter permease [Aminiphilus sp.]
MHDDERVPDNKMKTPDSGQGIAPEKIEVKKDDVETLFGDVFRAFQKNRSALVGLCVVLFITVLALSAPYVLSHDPYTMNLDNRNQPPSEAHWFGTDTYGRDLMARVIFGARISLVIGLIPAFLATCIGSILGVASGFYGGKTDFWIMRLADVVLAFPSLLLAMVIMYTLGANLFNIFIALSIVGWASTSRIVRSQTLALKEKEFVEAARALGVKNRTIIFRHILPNCLPNIMVVFTMSIPSAIMQEAGLSFLGVGAQPPTPSWGLLVSQGKEFIFSAPWVAIIPGVAILILVLAFNFMGDGLRDAIDPYMKD